MASGSGPRMGLLIDRHQPVNADVRIDLRRRERGVAEDLLDAAEVSAALEQVGGRRMPQSVRTGVRNRAGCGDPGMDDPADGARVDPAASRAEEERRLAPRGAVSPAARDFGPG